MVRHFETLKEARAFKKSQNSDSINTHRKLKGHKNRVKKPFVVCSFIEWLNLN